MVTLDEGTSNGLERDPKVHGHVRGVEEDNGVHVLMIRFFI